MKINELTQKILLEKEREKKPKKRRKMNKRQSDKFNESQNSQNPRRRDEVLAYLELQLT